jgi:ATP-dependent helicase/nuclease subunit A
VNAGGTTEEDIALAASRAIYAFRRNLVLAASAGTGKTHALVGVAVHLLMGACRSRDGTPRPPIRPAGLVATTFSRKAAGEIRARLADELERLAGGDPRAAYRSDLLAAYALGGVPVTDGELAARAARALAGLGRARIGTLHSYAASIVRAHALVLGLSPDFDLPDEETAAERAREIIEGVLERHAADHDVAALIGLAGSTEALIDLVRRLLGRLGEDGHGATALELAEGDALAIDASFQQLIDRTRDLTSDGRLGEAARALLSARESPELPAFEDAMGDLWSLPRTAKPSPAAAAFFDLRDSLSRGARLRDRGRAFVRRWRVREQLLPRARALKGLLVACEGALAEKNRADSVLGFTDVLRAARDVLRDRPEIAAETGAELDALLVDEFQDTSGVQRDLVLLLWERDGRRGELRTAGTIPSPAELREEGLLVVGDRKQSIYGFRGADVAVFAELAVGLAGAPAREALRVPQGLVWEPDVPSADFVPLRHNRRGAPELLEFANAYSRLSLVPQGARPALYEVAYAPATEDLKSPRPPPNDSRAVPRTRWLRLPVPAGKLTPSLLSEAEVMTARIASIVRRGEVTVSGGPARWRDVAILAPRHEMLAAAAYTLAQAGIPHVVAGMGFYSAAEVRDVIAMLACLVDPDDSLSRAAVLRSPWAGATDRTLVALTDRHLGLADVDRWSAGERRLLADADGRAAVAALGRTIARLRGVVARIGPGPALREAVHALALEEVLVLLPRGEQRVANVRKLLAMADSEPIASELLHRWRNAAELERREGEAETFSDEDDAVRLLTVHGSKGLSFPIVFLPEAGGVSARGGAHDAALLEPRGAGRPPRLALRVQDEVGVIHDTPSYEDAKRDLMRRDAAERLRLRYVGMTRASEAMYFVGDRAPPKGPRDAYDTSTAAILARLADDDASLRAAQLVVETGESLERAVAVEASAHPEPLPPHRRLPILAPRQIVVSAALLQAAAHCARRYQLDKLAPATRPLSLVEPSSRLAAAGDWGARVVHDRPRVRTRQTVVLPPDPEEARPPSVSVAATIDQMVLWPDGSVDVLRFMAPAPDPAADELLLSLLFHATWHTYPGSESVRVGFLGEDARAEPAWVATRDLAWTRGRTTEAVERILSMSRDGLALRVPFASCTETGCPHVAGCYPRGDGALPRAQSSTAQTAFDFFASEAKIAGGRGKRARGR